MLPFKNVCLQTLVEKRLTNLRNHHARIRETYFPDWDKLMQENCKLEHIPEEFFRDSTAPDIVEETDKAANETKLRYGYFPELSLY